MTVGMTVADAIEDYLRAREDRVYAWYRGDVDLWIDPKQHLVAAVNSVVGANMPYENITVGESIANAVENYCRMREELIYAGYRGDVDRRTADQKRELAKSIDEVVKQLMPSIDL